jgi:asparagine N-glycosylation enzyme membrane subunit Stt3
MTVAQSNRATGGQGASVIERLPVPLAGVALAAFVLTAVLLTAHPEVLRGDLIDTDSYMHLVRLRAVIADGSWLGGFFQRDNAPFGMVLHWTKAYDLMLLALAAPLAAFVGWGRALMWLAPAIGPLAVFAVVMAAVWAMAPICETAERRLAGIVLALAPMVLTYGSVGDADHHVMVVAVWLLFMGFTLRVAIGGGLRQGVWAGLAAAFALWLSVECILGVALGIALMGLAWVRDGEGLRRASLGFAATFALAMALLLALDAPHGGWLEVEPDRLSVLYVAFALLLTLLWGVLALVPQCAEAWRTRLGVAAAGAALCAICLVALFPAIFAPEQAVFGAELGDQVWNDVDEMVPVFRRFGTGIMLTGSIAIGLAVAVTLTWRRARPPALALRDLSRGAGGTAGRRAAQPHRPVRRSGGARLAAAVRADARGRGGARRIAASGRRRGARGWGQPARPGWLQRARGRPGVE